MAMSQYWTQGKAHSKRSRVAIIPVKALVKAYRPMGTVKLRGCPGFMGSCSLMVEARESLPAMKCAFDLIIHALRPSLSAHRRSVQHL